MSQFAKAAKRIIALDTSFDQNSQDIRVLKMWDNLREFHQSRQEAIRPPVPLVDCHEIMDPLVEKFVSNDTGVKFPDMPEEFDEPRSPHPEYLANLGSQINVALADECAKRGVPLPIDIAHVLAFFGDDVGHVRAGLKYLLTGGDQVDDIPFGDEVMIVAGFTSGVFTAGPLNFSIMFLNDGRPVKWSCGSNFRIAGDHSSGWMDGAMVANNMMNCRNVVLVDAETTRAGRRREQRIGLRTSKIAVKSSSKSSNNRKGDSDTPPKALHSVRGHISHYGNCCPGRHEPRGKLFGHIEGRIWVPQHARGDISSGETAQTFELES